MVQPLVRMILRNTLILVLTVIAAVGAFAQERTELRDRAASAMLLGTHRLSLQWISWDYFGTATVRNARGTYRMTGQQKGRGSSASDLLTVDGWIVSVDAKEFVFRGKIVTKISHINGGEPCVRDGEFIFRITGKRRYWRMQQIDNPCDQAADYVDIYFR